MRSESAPPRETGAPPLLEQAWERTLDRVEALNEVRDQVKLIKMSELPGRTPPAEVVATMSRVALLLGRERTGGAPTTFVAAAHAELNTPEKLDYKWGEIELRLGRPRNQFVNEVHACDVEGMLALPKSLARVRHIVATGELDQASVQRANKARGRMWQWVLAMLDLLDEHAQLDERTQAQVIELSRNPELLRKARQSILRAARRVRSFRMPGGGRGGQTGWCGRCTERFVAAVLERLGALLNVRYRNRFPSCFRCRWACRASTWSRGHCTRSLGRRTGPGPGQGRCTGWDHRCPVQRTAAKAQGWSCRPVCCQAPPRTG